MRYFISAAAVLAVLFSGKLDAETYSGTVADSAAGTAIESVLVKLAVAGTRVYTDDRGEFSISTVSVGEKPYDTGRPLPVRFDPSTSYVSWSGFDNVSLFLHDVTGRIKLSRTNLSGMGHQYLPVDHGSGLFILTLDAGKSVFRMKIVSTGYKAALSVSPVKTLRQKSSAVTDTLLISRSGYHPVSVPVSADTSVNVALPALKKISTAMRSSIVHRGVTFTLDKAMPVGQFHNGDPFVVSNQAFSVTDVDPASGSNGEYMVNGMMIDPWVADTQGFDQTMSIRGCCGASSIPYSDAVNDDPAVNGAISIAQGAAHSLVKTKRRSDTGTGPTWGVIEEYVVLTVLPAAPVTGAFRPGMSNASQEIHSFENINWRSLRSLTLPSGVPDVTTALGYQKRVLPYFGGAPVSGENLRRMQTDYDLDAVNYSGTIAPYRSLLGYLLHADVTQSQKEEMAAIIVQHGLDIYADYQKGFLGGRGAGQHHGYHFYLWFTAFLLNDADMLLAAQTMKSNMQSHPRWIPEEMLGYAASFPGPSGQQSRYRETFFQDDIGKPFWTEIFRGSNTYGRYATITLVIGGIEVLPVLLLQDGPEGVTGYEAILRGPDANGKYDTSNDRAAVIAVRDRVNTWQDRERSFVQGSGKFYEEWRPYIPLPQWTGTPDQFGGMYTQNFFSAEDKGISWDVSPYRTYSTLPVIEYHIRYSLDEIQFVETDGQNSSGTITGLIPDAPHYCQLAAENAKGRAKWSVNYPVAAEPGSFSDGPRNVVTPTGSAAAAAPVRTLDPAIHYKPHPAWKGPYYEPAPTDDTLSADILTLYAGAGYYSGYPAPAFTYQWKRNGTDITNADSVAYSLTVDDLGTQVSCEVTATNGSGNTSFTTVPVIIRGEASLPPGVVVDTDFSGRFALDFPDELAGAVAANCNLIHRPTFMFDGLEGLSAGVIHGDKTGARPNWYMLFTRNVLAGSDYRLNTETVIGYGTDWNRGNGYLRIIDNETNAVYLDITLIQTAYGTPEAVTIDTVFTVPAGAAASGLQMKMGVNTSTGAGSLGDTYLSRLSIIREH